LVIVVSLWACVPAAETAVELLGLVIPDTASKPHLQSFKDFLSCSPARRVTFDEVRAVQVSVLPARPWRAGAWDGFAF
jgi:hypothetical protein